MNTPVAIDGVLVGFAVAELDTGEHAILARAQMRDGGEVVLKWCASTPSDVKEVADFWRMFAIALDVENTVALNEILDGGDDPLS